jgi:hypothetical protein
MVEEQTSTIHTQSANSKRTAPLRTPMPQTDLSVRCAPASRAPLLPPPPRHLSLARHAAHKCNEPPQHSRSRTAAPPASPRPTGGPPLLMARAAFAPHPLKGHDRLRLHGRLRPRGREQLRPPPQRAQHRRARGLLLLGLHTTRRERATLSATRARARALSSSGARRSG